MLTTKSKDGTTIAYEKIGNGSSLIIVSGALSHRTNEVVENLAAELSDNFTVFYYDRRGRGDSTDIKPYSVKKEIEDLEAVIKEAGGSVFLFGSSSGAALSLLAAQALGPKQISKLALYEPPYGSDSSNDKQHYAETKAKVNQLVADKKSGEAVATFFAGIGMPPEELNRMKQSPMWKDMEAVGHTLVYDYEILGDGTIPVDIAKKVAVPTQLIVGQESFDFMKVTADALIQAIPDGTTVVLEGQSHNASPEVLAPVLVEFFGSPVSSRREPSIKK